MSEDYLSFLKSKEITVPSVGITISKEAINPVLFPFQRDIVAWAVRKGRAAIFADVGLGKTGMQLEWAKQIGVRTIIIAPLSVAQQTVAMAQTLLGYDIRYIRNSNQVSDDCNIYVTNYEMIDHIDASMFEAVVLDESSILKSLTGSTKTELIEKFSNTPYRLACTATPAPNDLLEIANHAEFLGVMKRSELMAVFFTYDSGLRTSSDSNGRRLKKHSVEHFYKWLSSWAVALKKPSDIGYSDEFYTLPQLNQTIVTVPSDYTPEGLLPGIGVDVISAVEAKRVRRMTIPDRSAKAIEIVGTQKQWVIWTALNEEADTLAALIPDSINIHGSLSIEEKVDGIAKFISGETRVLITKTSIAGMGINMQTCHNMLFFGIDYSWESFYQAVGRVYRFGQKYHEVNVVVLTSELEEPIYQTIVHKGIEASVMTKQLIEAAKIYTQEKLSNTAMAQFDYQTDETSTRNYTLKLGDSCERMSEIADDSVHLSVYSPPFSDLFVYSNTDRDLGNSANIDTFLSHYQYIIKENYRITMPGRLCCVHIADARFMVGLDGYKGRRDLSGMVIEAYQKEGWIFWQRITIDKNPQAQAIRMKDSGLLFKTLKTDSAGLAGGHPDYVLVFKKPGDNPVPITPFANDEVSANDWIKWAHPVWTDIQETNTLNVSVARGDKDEKHVCPLQLDVIERCVRLWSNPEETVFSPFAGIGSELYVAIKQKRFGLGIELKPEYYKVALKNLNEAASTRRTLFDFVNDEAVGD